MLSLVTARYSDSHLETFLALWLFLYVFHMYSHLACMPNPLGAAYAIQWNIMFGGLSTMFNRNWHNISRKSSHRSKPAPPSLPHAYSLPFALVETTGWATIAIVTFISYGVLGVISNAAELENPFGSGMSTCPTARSTRAEITFAKRNTLLTHPFPDNRLSIFSFLAGRRL